MNAKQLYYTLVATLVLVLAGFVGIAYMTNKLLGTQAQKLSTQRAKGEALDTQQTTLTKNKQDLVKYPQTHICHLPIFYPRGQSRRQGQSNPAHPCKGH
jgi:hypothetical protein